MAEGLPVDQSTLAEELARHNIALPGEQVAKLDAYCQALWEWNEKINLTRHTTYEKFVGRDLVDTLQFAAVLAQGERVVDVGTGGGVPGVVLGIVRPDLRIALTDSVAKKAKAVGEIVRQVGVNVAVHSLPAQTLLVEGKYDALVVRAVAPLTKLLNWFEPHWGAFARLLVIKGPAWVEERADARHRGLMSDLQLRKLASWPLPGTESESVLLEIRPKQPDDPTAERY